MYVTVPQPQLLIRSFGFGLMSMELVPCPDTMQMSEQEHDQISSRLLEILQNSGLVPQVVILDPDDCSRGFYLIATGHAPTIYEIAQLTPDVIYRLKCLSKANAGPFSERVELLLEYVAKLTNEA